MSNQVDSQATTSLEMAARTAAEVLVSRMRS
jgi:hypothetical protein